MRNTLLTVVLLLPACVDRRPEPPKPPITVFAAASLARPFKVLADSFQRRNRVVARVELGGSMDHARKLTELGRIPDVLMLVDDDVMASLMPAHIDWYVRFATNRVVIAYTDKSRHADSIVEANWWQVLGRNDVTVGRADPTVAPAGKHALALLQRSEAYYKKPGLTARLLTRAGLAYMRPNATELAALLETGEVDYILDYESVARQYGFKFVALPEDLTTTVTYGMSVPRRAANFRGGVEFAAFVLSEEGKGILRASNVDVLSVPVAVGSGIPPEVSTVVRIVSAGSIAR